jgi:hypothetical protein
VKPVGAPGSPFKQEGDFLDALKSHHQVMVKAMGAKQSVDVAAADALEHAVRPSSLLSPMSSLLSRLSLPSFYGAFMVPIPLVFCSVPTLSSSSPVNPSSLVPPHHPPLAQVGDWAKMYLPHA